jgi:hypothetical protein
MKDFVSGKGVLDKPTNKTIGVIFIKSRIKYENE